MSQRMSQVQVASLRRQLMRDNYNYQHPDGERRQQNGTERNVDDAVKFYNPQAGTDHLQRASELDQANVNSFSAEHEPRGQNARGRHRELGIYQESRQNDQREFSEPQEQLGQFDEQEPSMERKDRAVPPLTDAPPAPSDELTVRYVSERPTRLAGGVLQQATQRPFGDLRGSYVEPIPRSDAANDQRVQKEQTTENKAQSPEQELSPDETEAFDLQAFDRLAFDLQDRSGSENEGSPIGRRMNPAGSQASPTSSRLSPIGSWVSSAGTHSKPPRHAGTTGPPDLPRTKRAHSFVVTVSPNNVTYKLLTLKSRDGRRRVDRRLLEERGPEGVAIISLDRAPLPAFRLPRARRQYMHDHRHHRHKPA